MSEEVQNIRIKFITDDSDLNKAEKSLDKITESEREAVNAFNKANKAAKEQEGILERLAKDEKTLLASRQKSNDPKAIAMYNKQLEATRSQIRTLTAESQKGASTMSTAFSSVGASIIAAFSIGAITAFGSKIISITSEFEKFKAVLATSLGSKSLAETAFATIQKTAANTNFGVLELTNNFVKLTNAGFQPTEKEIIKLADLANTTGKSFDQLSEAIIDAQTGEFERLKEFGIRASKEGDKVTFTFKEQKTQVDLNASSIRQYILGLGDLEGVLGSTAAISATVEGRISNLGDAFDSLLYTLGSAKSGIFKDAVEGLTGFISALEMGAKTSEQFNDVLINNVAASKTNQITASMEADLEKYRKNGLLKTKEETEQFYQTQVSILNSAADANKQYLAELQKELDKLNDKSGITAINELVSQGIKQSDATEMVRKRIAELPEEINNVSGTLKAQEQVIANINKTILAGQKAEEAAAEKRAKAAKDAQKIRDKAFKDAMDDLKRREDIARRENKIEGGGDTQDLQIQEYYQQQRLSIVQKYLGKTNVTYEEAALHIREIEKEQTDLLIKEEQERAAEREKIAKEKTADDLKVLDDTSKKRLFQNEQQNASDIESLRKNFANRSITFKEFQEQESQLKYQAARKDLEDEITIDKEKLNVEGLSADQRFAIEQDLFDKENELRNLDFEEFSKNEEKKSQKAKEEAALRQQIAQSAFETGVSIINSLSEISQNNTQAEINNLKVKQDRELALAGENKQKQAQINETYARRQQELNLKLAKQQRSNAIFNATVSAAESIVKTMASTPYPANIILSALAGVAAYAQVKAIQSQPLPAQYFKGTEFVELNGNPKGRDTVPAMLHEGERVVPADINKKLKGISNKELPTLLDIYNSRIDYSGITKRIGSYDNSSGNTAELVNEFKKVGKKIDQLQKVEITIDKKGINTMIRNNQSQTEFVNNYFRV